MKRSMTAREWKAIAPQFKSCTDSGHLVLTMPVEGDDGETPVTSFVEIVDSWLPIAREVVKTCTAGEVDGMVLDLFTASGLVNVADRLRPAPLARFAALPLPNAVDIMWNLSGKPATS